MLDWLRDGPTDASARLVLTHGAGAPMDTPFMNHVAVGLAARGLEVWRFEFPYMAKRRIDGKRRGPGNAKGLLTVFRQAVDEAGDDRPLFIGGKSMGGRVASMVAHDAGVAGLVCLGYPFHPPGKPESLRTAHLQDLAVPTLIIQGERDPFGQPEEVAGYGLPSSMQVLWLPDGDHSFKPRKRSGFTLDAHLDQAVGDIHRFISGVVAA